MKIIVALGNPGEKYKNTRHNAGWLGLGYLVESGLQAVPSLSRDLKLKVESWEQKFKSEIAQATVGDKKILLVKPQTFMNESGSAVAEVVNFYKADISKDLLVIHDEADLPLGTIRPTASSSAAGHNGVKDIIEKLGTQDFHRLRIGVESRTSRDVMPTDAFVLQNFTAEELQKLNDEVFPKVSDEINKFLKIL